MESENIHAGHRERQKEKFAQHGLDAFTDVEAVELLLYYALPRRDTNPLSHRLLDRFGGLKRLMEAQYEELLTVDGVGAGTAALICLVRELNRRYLQTLRQRGEVLCDAEQVGDYLLPMFLYQTEERLVVLCLDGGLHVLSCKVLGEGSGALVRVTVRQIVDHALREKAVRVILAHNHPGGNALPSSDDLKATARLREALGLVGVELTDHLIFADDDFVSLRESGCFDTKETGFPGL